MLAARPLHGGLQLGHDSCFGDVGLLSQTPRIHFLLGRVRALCQHIHSFLHVFQPLGILCQIVLAAQTAQPEVQCIAHTVQQGFESLCAILFDVLVRVLCTGDLQHAHLYRAVAEQFQRAQRGLLARFVRIVAQDHLVSILADEPHLLRGQGRAAGAHCCVDACLMHTDHVHVALAQHEPAHRAALCDLQRKHRL